MDKKTDIRALGRRKTASCLVQLSVAKEAGQKGAILVNNRPIEQYFVGPFAKEKYIEPFRITNTLNKFYTTINVTGSGPTGQLDAVVLGISRALVSYDPEKFRSILRKRGFLTRDPRAKERKKPGLMGARKEKQSPKR